jgi:hypothetical protein
MASWQLELGSQATSYAAYFEPIELCKIGDYQDSIYKSDNKWYVHKATASTTLDQMVWTNEAAGSGYGRRYRSTTLVGQIYQIGSNSDIAAMDCSHYTVGNMNSTWTGGGQAIALHTNKSIYIYDERFKDEQTTTALDSWLGSAKPSLYYPLATPTDTEITNQALVAQLEAILQEARMYNPQTNITTLYADGNEQGTLSISYFTDKNPDTRDELIIDSRLRTITLNGLDVYHLQAPGSEFLMLAPGENRLALQSDITGDNGYAQVSYKQGYLSI